MSGFSIADESFEHKMDEMRQTREARRARRMDRLARWVTWGATSVVAVAALSLGAWSNQIVAQWLGFPGVAGWAAACVLDGLWVVSLAVAQVHRAEPWKALSAHQAVLGMVALSAATNFAHGLIRFGVSPRGAAAGLMFALLPVSLKWLLSVASSSRSSLGQLLKAPDAKERIRQAGQISSELDLHVALAPIRGRANQGSDVRVERVRSEPPVELGSGSRTPQLETARTEVNPDLEPEVQVEPRAVGAFGTRTERVNHLAGVVGERGGQLNSLTLAEVAKELGIEPTKKSTLSGLRKDAHQAWLAKVNVGQYL